MFEQRFEGVGLVWQLSVVSWPAKKMAGHVDSIKLKAPGRVGGHVLAVDSGNWLTVVDWYLPVKDSASWVSFECIRMLKGLSCWLPSKLTRVETLAISHVERVYRTGRSTLMRIHISRVLASILFDYILFFSLSFSLLFFLLATSLRLIRFDSLRK